MVEIAGRWASVGPGGEGCCAGTEIGKVIYRPRATGAYVELAARSRNSSIFR